MDALLDHRYEPRDYHRKKPRWYHTAMIDWMMANPGRPLSELAAHVNRKLPTVSAIVRSDLFQAALAQRKREFSAAQDARVREKLTEVTVSSLDTILKVLETKKDKVPLGELTTLANSTLQRLGYGVPQSGPTVQMNNYNGGVQQIATPVSAEELQDARIALRQNQQRIASTAVPPPSPGGEAIAGGSTAPLDVEYIEVQEKGAAPAPGQEEGDSVAPALRKT